MIKKEPKEKQQRFLKRRKERMMKNKVCLLILLSLTPITGAALQTVSYEGTISDYGFYMGGGYDPALFSIGDDFAVTVAYDDTDNTLESISYSISNLASGGGSLFNQTISDFTGFSTNVNTDNGLFVSVVKVSPYFDIMSLTFDRTNADDNFSHNYNHPYETEYDYAWNFNATLVPEPATMALLGLGGLFFRRMKKA